MALRTWLDLFPYRLSQALAGRTLRKMRTTSRRRAAQQRQLGVDGPQPRRLFVDVAVISRHDAGTGIQRVVRELAHNLAETAPEKWDIHFVAADRRRGYHCIDWPCGNEASCFVRLAGRPGDVFLGLDYSIDAIRWHRSQLAQFQRNGGRLWFLVHDLLPLERPEWFSRNTRIRYEAWLDILAGCANGFLCNSPQTELDLKQSLAKRYGLTAGYHTAVLPMGHSIREAPSEALANELTRTNLKLDLSDPFVLMVGTLEPRKGHADIICAFEELWRNGSDSRLVLVGRQGWQIDGLRERILRHLEHQRKLVWLDDVHDAELEAIYQACEGVIVASHGEGFGLPLIEALGRGKPVLARDLPVFRPHEAYGVRYFPADCGPASLARYVEAWLGDISAARIAVVQPNSSWKDSAQTLLATLERA